MCSLLYTLRNTFRIAIAYPLPTTRDNYIHGHHQMVNTEIRLIIFFCSGRWRSSIQSAKSRPGTDCGSYHELLIPKFRLKLKKVRETTRAFRYDLIKPLTIIQWK